MKKLLIFFFSIFLFTTVYSQEAVFKHVRSVDSVRLLIENTKPGGAPVNIEIKNTEGFVLLRLDETGNFTIDVTATSGAKLDVNGGIWQIGTGKSVFLGEGAGNLDDLMDNKNVYIGYHSGCSNITEMHNTFIGYNTGININSGGRNIIIGSSGGYYTSGGSSLQVMDKSLLIGMLTRANDNNETNQIVIGDEAIGNGSNTATIGNDNVTDIYAGEDAQANVRMGGLRLAGSTTMTSVSTGAGDNDKAVTQGYVDDRLHKITVNLSAAEVNTLGGAYEIISQPGAGKYIRIISWDCKITVTTQLEVGIQDLYLKYVAGDRIGSIENTAIETTTTKRFFGIVDDTNITILINTGIAVILSGSGNPTSGSVTMSFNITYEILTD